MRTLFSIIILSVTTTISAQKPMDSILASDIKMFTQFFPGAERGIPNAALQMPPDAFINKLDSFKMYAYGSTEKIPDAAKKELRKKDVDAFSRMMLSIYRQDYGIDSAVTQKYYELISKNEKPDSATQKTLDSLSAARFAKKMTPADSLRLDSLIFGGLEMKDSALFVISAAYKRMVEQKLRKIEMEKYADLSSGESMFKQKMLNEVLKNGYVFEYFSYENMEFVLNSSKDPDVVELAYNEYMSNTKNISFRTEIKTAYNNFKALAKNKPAPDFIYQDINGKTVSLKQLKGKYVYIDVWATWCGPCKMEIPHLTKLEEEYAGKNIHFVSLSVDNQKDKGNWEKYVKTNKLKGIQLMADKDFKSDFVQKFNITYIPRFILIDPAGKIFDANALRPSDEQLRKQLDGLL